MEFFYCLIGTIQAGFPAFADAAHRDSVMVWAPGLHQGQLWSNRAAAQGFPGYRKCQHIFQRSRCPEILRHRGGGPLQRGDGAVRKPDHEGTEHPGIRQPIDPSLPKPGGPGRVVETIHWRYHKVLITVEIIVTFHVHSIFAPSTINMWCGREYVNRLKAWYTFSALGI